MLILPVLPLRLHRDHIILLRGESAFLENLFLAACSPLLEAAEYEDEKGDEGDTAGGGVDGYLGPAGELAPFLRDGFWGWFVGFLGEEGGSAV